MMNINIYEALSIKKNERVALVGCGGKTTTMWLLAEHCRGLKTLVTTTTRIRKPSTGFDYMIIGDEAFLNHEPKVGVQVTGVEDRDVRKLLSLDVSSLAIRAKDYDVVIMESDGSNSLPIKGWESYEPVIPTFTTCTVGVITLGSLNKKANIDVVHRLGIFLKDNEVDLNEVIDLNIIAKTIVNDNGMFSRAQGVRSLIVNLMTKREHSGREEELDNAKELSHIIADMRPSYIDKFIIGNAIEDMWIWYQH